MSLSLSAMASDLAAACHEDVAAIAHAIRAHTLFAREPKNRVRLFDELTPYWVHPVRCGLLLRAETLLSANQRKCGAHALYFHDLEEDTTERLPPGTSAEVIELTASLIFRGGSSEKMAVLPSRPPFVRLLGLCDTFDNVRDGYFTWMMGPKRGEAYRRKYLEFAVELAAGVDRDLQLIVPGAPAGATFNICREVRGFHAAVS